MIALDNKASKEVVELLLAKGADPNAKNQVPSFSCCIVHFGAA